MCKKNIHLHIVTQSRSGQVSSRTKGECCSLIHSICHQTDVLKYFNMVSQVKEPNLGACACTTYCLTFAKMLSKTLENPIPKYTFNGSVWTLQY